MSNLNLNILSDQQELVYRTALELGGASVQDIAQHAQLPRTSVYLYLNELKQKGLVSETKHGKKTLFIAEPPHQLLRLFDRYQSGLALEKTKVLTTLPELEALYNVHTQTKPIIRFYDGFEGVKNVHEQTLEAKEMLVICSGYTQPLSKELNDYLENDHFQQIKIKHIATKEIVTKDIDFDHYMKEYSSPINEIRVANVAPSDRHLDKIIFGSCVATIAYDTMQATVVQHYDIAVFEKNVFMQLWDTLK